MDSRKQSIFESELFKKDSILIEKYTRMYEEGNELFSIVIARAIQEAKKETIDATITVILKYPYFNYQELENKSSRKEFIGDINKELKKRHLSTFAWQKRHNTRLKKERVLDNK